MRRATEEAHITCSKSRNVYTRKVDAGALITGQREQTLMTSLWAQQSHKYNADDVRGHCFYNNAVHGL